MKKLTLSILVISVLVLTIAATKRTTAATKQVNSQEIESVKLQDGYTLKQDKL